MPTTIETVAVLLLAVVPGYLAISIWSRAKTWKGPPGDLRTVLQALVASVAVQVAAAPLTIWLLRDHQTNLVEVPERVYVWLAFVVFVIPGAGGLLVAKLPNRWSARDFPSGWDWLLCENPPNSKFVTVEFADGRRVGGCFASESHAFTSPDRHGIFLEQEWVLNGEGSFERPVSGSEGVLITDMADARIVRVFGEEDGEDKSDYQEDTQH